MSEQLFRLAYETQEQLIAAQPEHPLAQKKYMSNPQRDCYSICIDHYFIVTYQQSGINSQLTAFIGDLEKAIEAAQKKQEHTAA